MPNPEISLILRNWYRENHRDLPWRNTRNPYLIWLSEILLQQTRVDQGLPYYQRFTDEFPSINDLADAPEDKIMKLWQGLGYYSRARNLHKTAKIVKDEYKGIFPTDYQHIIKLPGVGAYTAAAITSFAYNQPFPVVDGNVYRVISRLFGISTPIDSVNGKKEFYEAALQILDKKAPGDHNQAIMEFGALYCKPTGPDCIRCIFSSTCEAFINKMVSELPVKSKKTRIRERHFNYLLLRQNDTIILNKRGAGDIWQNLFDFPLIETNEPVNAMSISSTEEWKQFFKNNKITINSVSELAPHKLSHQVIHTRVFDISVNAGVLSGLGKDAYQVNTQDVVNYAVPRIIEKILEEKLENYGE